MNKSSFYCNTCHSQHYLGDESGNAGEQALKLFAVLKKEKRVDIDIEYSKRDLKFSTDILYGKALGQMFGVLECYNKNSEIVFLKAFSGKFNGEWEIQGWAPPLFNLQDYNFTEFPIERKIKELGREINKLSKMVDSSKNQTIIDQIIKLKSKRRKISQNLMMELHRLYRLPNFLGDKMELDQFQTKKKGIATGTADCCGPKLLGYAANLGYKAISLAEFYLGLPNQSRSKYEGKFYPPCIEKCSPILGSMLCGNK